MNCDIHDELNSRRRKKKTRNTAKLGKNNVMNPMKVCECEQNERLTEWMNECNDNMLTMPNVRSYRSVGTCLAEFQTFLKLCNVHYRLSVASHT